MIKECNANVYKINVMRILFVSKNASTEFSMKKMDENISVKRLNNKGEVEFDFQGFTSNVCLECE